MKVKSLGAFDGNAMKMLHSMYWRHAMAWVQPALLEARVERDIRVANASEQSVT